MDMYNYPHLASLMEELESLFKGIKGHIKIDINRFVYLLTDVTKLLYSRADRLGSDMPLTDWDTLTSLKNCVNAIMRKLESAEISNYLVAGKLELETMMHSAGFNDVEFQYFGDENGTEIKPSVSDPQLLAWHGVPRELLTLLQTLTILYESYHETASQSTTSQVD